MIYVPNHQHPPLYHQLELLPSQQLHLPRTINRTFEYKSSTNLKQNNHVKFLCTAPLLAPHNWVVICFFFFFQLFLHVAQMWPCSCHAIFGHFSSSSHILGKMWHVVASLVPQMFCSLSFVQRPYLYLLLSSLGTHLV